MFSQDNEDMQKCIVGIQVLRGVALRRSLELSPAMREMARRADEVQPPFSSISHRRWYYATQDATDR